ncbi:MAG TPA: TadG family pilus assembly protein [Rhizomicrobium sp.]
MSKGFFRNGRGNISAIAALMMTATVGVGGLVAEYGNGLFSRIEDQRYADIAAMAGATNYSVNDSVTAMQTTVSRASTLNGLPSADAVGTVVTSPTGDGNQAVKVVVSTSVPLLLSRLIEPNSTLPVQATAYAELKQTSTACVLALDATAHQAITVSGSANVNAPHCDVVSDSNNSDAFDMSGSAKMTAACTFAVGGDNLNSGLTLTACSAAKTHQSSVADPYATVATPILPTSQCLSVPTLPATIQAGYYCHGLSVNGTATFASGQYYVVGNLAIQGSSSVTGTGVTFYITKSGTTAISGSATATLSAPTTGTYAGILFFGDRTATTSNNNNISGSSASTLTGVLYYPTQQITYSGGSNAGSTCTQLVGDVITFSGSTNVGNSCTGTGVQTISVPGQAYASLVQ